MIWLIFVTNLALSLGESPPLSPCMQPKAPGPCRNRGRTKYYFNQETGTCDEFTFHCGGNENRFDSVADCVSTCRNFMQCGMIPPPFPLPGMPNYKPCRSVGWVYNDR